MSKRSGMSHSDAAKLASRKTSRKKYLERLSSYASSPKMCGRDGCDESLSYDKRFNRFCSQSCAAIHNNSGSIRKKRGNCVFCSEPLDSPGKKYCNSQCCGKQKRKETREKIENNEYDSDDNKILKSHIIEMFDHECSICGIEEWRGEPVPLVLDHISGNASDNSVSNLRLVCGNCNMQLPTFTSKNKGNGRHWRRERYAQGKSS